MSEPILILEANPAPDRFSAAIATSYANSARAAGQPARILNLRDLHFDPILRTAQGATGQTLEPDLQRAQSAILDARHLVFVFPIWWGNLPALLKGFLDRILLPGWAYRNTGKPLPEGLLAGRSARIFTTMDSPWWWYWLKHGRAAHRALTQATLHYCGITTVTHRTAYRLRSTTPVDRDAFLAAVATDAGQDIARLPKAHP